MAALLSSAGKALPSFAPFQLTSFVVSLAYMGYSPDTAWVNQMRVRL